MKTLIVYYSFTGKTEIVSNELARQLNADVRRVEDLNPYSMVKAFFWGAFEAIRGRGGAIKPVAVDLAAYDRIFVGSPVWGWNGVPAVNTFIDAADFHGKSVVVFATMGGSTGKTLTNMGDRIARKGGKVTDSFALRTGGVSDQKLTEAAREMARKFR